MQQKSLLCLSTAGFHKIAYTEWGDPNARQTIVCCHGLTRNSRDFDALAAQLSKHARVVCPDIVGRGDSDWLSDPTQYSYPQYCADMNALIARLDVDQLDWIGTSMGGLIGMTLAAQAKTPLRRLIVNDVGPFVPKAALQRIANYIGLDSCFLSIDAIEAYMRKIFASFGPLNDKQWQHIAKHSHRLRPDGSFTLAYDPAIAVNVKMAVQDWDLWSIWDRITIPTLALRGAESDLLL